MPVSIVEIVSVRLLPSSWRTACLSGFSACKGQALDAFSALPWPCLASPCLLQSVGYWFARDMDGCYRRRCLRCRS